VVKLILNLDGNILLYKHLELHDIERDHHYYCLNHSLDQGYEIVVQDNHFQKQMYVHRMDYVHWFYLEYHRDQEDLLIFDYHWRRLLHRHFSHLQHDLQKL
jgi:hypothetical protein